MVADAAVVRGPNELRFCVGCAAIVDEMATARTELATAADLRALPDAVRAEIIHGVIVVKASPSAEHGGRSSRSGPR